MAKQSILPAVWEVPSEFHARLGQQVGRQRIMVADGHLLIVLHRPPGPDESSRSGRFFWRHPDGSWRSNESGSGSAALAKHLSEYADLLSNLDEREQHASTADDYREVVLATTPLQRASRNMLVTLQEARGAIPGDRDLIDFRDRAGEIQRNAELICSDARGGLEFAVALRSEQQAAHSQRMAMSAHRLNVLAAFFFPIATLSSIFGVNLQHGFENYPPPIAFLTVIGVGLLAGLGLKIFVTRS